MKTLRKENIHPTYYELCPDKKDMAQGVMYISEKYKSMNHLCLCGCGIECALPIGRSDWSFRDNEKGLTVKPSIQQRFKCKSHYIITNGVANFV